MFAYCRNNPVSRKDASGTEDVCATDFGQDDNHANDLGNPSGSGSGGGGNGGTQIYRYGYDSAEKLVPTQNDVDSNTGLSFSTRPRLGSAVTTIEEINATGKLYAVQDSLYHVSVYPIGGTIGQWYDAGVNSIWTQALVCVVVKN